jgi:cobalamin 5'-phosphate synthase/cobalamin synthase
MTELRAAVAAVTFLTRVPLPRLRLDGGDVARAVVWFPLVGGGLGAVVGVVAWAGTHIVPPTLAAALGVTVGVVLTGALHLDALADAADALGGTSRERSLEIMRDHAVGAFGAAALGLDLIVRIVAIGALAGHGVVGAVAAAGALSRAGSAAVGAALPYARPEGGLGAAVARGSVVRVVGAAVLSVAFAAAVAGWHGLAAAAGVAVVAVLAAAWWRHWLGGVTGDTLGATSELAELTALVVLVAVA